MTADTPTVTALLAAIGALCSAIVVMYFQAAKRFEEELKRRDADITRLDALAEKQRLSAVAESEARARSTEVQRDMARAIERMADELARARSGGYRAVRP